METPSPDAIIEGLLRRAYYWRQEAAHFAGRPKEKVCTEHAQRVETLAELERLRKLDEI
jgi:hypothetical protein